MKRQLVSFFGAAAMLLGVATVLLVLFLPRGMVGTLLRRRPQWRRYIP